MLNVLPMAVVLHESYPFHFFNIILPFLETIFQSPIIIMIRHVFSSPNLWFGERVGMTSPPSALGEPPPSLDWQVFSFSSLLISPFRGPCEEFPFSLSQGVLLFYKASSTRHCETLSLPSLRGIPFLVIGRHSLSRHCEAFPFSSLRGIPLLVIARHEVPKQSRLS